jgi:hypothetical protein
MNIDDNMNMSPSEKLNMLLDGETSGIEPSEVFYELSNSPELQQEFLDIVKLKQLMNGTVEAPPENLRRGILAGIGLGGGGFWYYVQNSGVVASTAAFVASKVGVAIIALLFGAFSTVAIMNSFESSNNKGNRGATIEQSSRPIAMSLDVPVVSSYSRENKAQDKVSSPAIKENGLASSNSNQLATTNDRQVSKEQVLVTDSSPFYMAFSDENASIAPTQELAFNQDNMITNLMDSERSGFIVNPANRIGYFDNSDRQLLFCIQGKGISNNSLQKPDLSTTESPAINDIGISLMYLVTNNLEVGLEFGQEFLVKRVKSGSFSVEESILENQLTFWGGLKANYTFNELEILPKLRPTSSLLLGGTNRGWVTKASAGLIYDISDKLAVFGGPEWTTGLYTFDSKILSTHKWGFNYGLSLRF